MRNSDINIRLRCIRSNFSLYDQTSAAIKKTELELNIIWNQAQSLINRVLSSQICSAENSLEASTLLQSIEDAQAYYNEKIETQKRLRMEIIVQTKKYHSGIMNRRGF